MHVLELLCVPERLVWNTDIHLRLYTPIYLVQRMTKIMHNQTLNAIYTQRLKCFSVVIVTMIKIVNVSSNKDKKFGCKCTTSWSQAQLKQKSINRFNVLLHIVQVGFSQCYEEKENLSLFPLLAIWNGPGLNLSHH